MVRPIVPPWHSLGLLCRSHFPAEATSLPFPVGRNFLVRHPSVPEEDRVGPVVGCRKYVPAIEQRDDGSDWNERKEHRKGKNVPYPLRQVDSSYLHSSYSLIPPSWVVSKTSLLSSFPLVGSLVLTFVVFKGFHLPTVSPSPLVLQHLRQCTSLEAGH